MQNGEGEALQSLKNLAGKVLRGRAHMSEAGRPCENGMRRRQVDLDHGQLKVKEAEGPCHQATL